MNIRALSFLGWCALACPCAAARAGQFEDANATGDLLASNLASKAAVVSAMSVEDYLRVAGRRAGVSFIFDSALVEGKVVTPPRASRSTQGIDNALGSAGLALHQVGASTFVVKPRAPVLLASAPAAQTAVAAALFPDVVVVTGTMLASAAGPTLNLEKVIDRQGLDRLNETTVERVVFNLPQTVSSITSSNTALFGAVAGINFADLRGIGAQRTSVFVDGRAATMTFAGNSELAGFDLNAIPEPFLERIELETGPAAARRDPRAVAGSLNFVLRKPREGFEAGGRTGTSQEGDAEEVSVYGLGGLSFAQGAGGVTFGAALTTLQGLLGADRAATATPYGYSPDGEFLPNFGNSPTTPAPAISGIALRDGDIVRKSLSEALRLTARDGYQPGLNREHQLYNWSSGLNTILPQERGYLYAAAEYAGADRLTLSADFRVAHVRTDIRIAPVPATLGRGVDPIFGDATVLDLTSASIPQSVRDRVEADYGDAASAIILDRRFVELGPRINEVDRTFIDAVLEAEYSIEEVGRLSAFYRYGRSGARQVGHNKVDPDRLAVALDPVLCEATRDCEEIDLFSRGGLNAVAADFIRATPLRRNLRASEHEVGAQWTHAPIAAPFGGVDLSAGVAARRTQLSDRPQLASRGRALGESLYNAFDATLDAVDVFGGIRTDLDTADLKLGEVALTVDARATFSPQHQTAHNIEFGAQWRINKDLEVFSRLHMGERPPTISELFYVGASDNFIAFDPCATSTKPLSGNVAANCASASPLGASGVDGVGLALRTDYGNPNLSNERIRTYVYGAAFNSDFDYGWGAGDVSLSFAWLDYAIDREITLDQNYLQACYNSVDLSDRNCGDNPITGKPIIQRDPATGRLSRTDIVLFNGGAFRWRGADAEMSLRIEPAFLPFVDQLIGSFAHTYTDRVAQASLAGDISYLQGLPAYPRQRTLVTLGAKRGGWEVVGVVNRRGAVETDRSGRPETRIGAYTYADVTVGRRLGDRADVRFSVENLTNLEPPIVAGTRVGNTMPEFYDLIGRRFALSLRYRF